VEAGDDAALAAAASASGLLTIALDSRG